MWKISIVGVLAAALFGTSLLANAQQGATQQDVQWQLQVMRDGQQIDSFDGTTTVGQARTDTHHKMVQHNVGCKDQPGGSIDLAIEAQETFEEDAARQTDTGCKLPPQPRQVSASHPGLKLAPGQWVSWTIVDKNPNLVYRVRASLATSAN